MRESGLPLVALYIICHRTIYLADLVKFIGAKPLSENRPLSFIIGKGPLNSEATFDYQMVDSEGKSSLLILLTPRA